jgi:hypothetical protein
MSSSILNNINSSGGSLDINGISSSVTNINFGGGKTNIGGAVDVTGVLRGLNSTSSTSSILGGTILSGGLAISNSTDSVSSTNGGASTIAGGLAVAKKVFIGTDLTSGGLIRFNDSTEAATNLSDGSVVLEGGIVVKRRLVVAGNIHVQSNLFGIGGNILVGDKLLCSLDCSIGETTVDGERRTTVKNLSTGTSSFTNLRLENSAGAGSIFLNGTARITDGPVSCLTIRNDITGGDLRILVSTNKGITLASNGNVSTTDNLTVGGNLTVTGSLSGSISHNSLTDLTSGDPHTQYTLGVGRSGGQTVTGSTAASGNLTLVSTSNATKGSVLFTETTSSTSSSTGSVILSGGLAISNSTDSVSSTNGGASTIAGGLAVAKKAFVGTDLTVGGLIRFTDTTDSPTNLTSGSVILEGGMVVKKRLVVADNVYVQNNLLGVSGNLTIGDNLFSTRDVIIGDASINAARTISLRNLNTGTSTFINLRFENSTGPVSIFLNGTNKTSDGGANSFTIRNEITGGDVRLLVSTNKGITLASNGNVSMTDNLTVGGNLTVTGSLTATISHNSLTNLTTGDPHTQYTLGIGRSGGQTITGSTAASGNLTLVSTSNATKGSVLFTETTSSTSSSTGSVILSGGLAISNATDSTSISNGGAATIEGGLAVAKKVFIGDVLNCRSDISIGELSVNGERRSTIKNVNTGTSAFSNLRLENAVGAASIYLNGSTRISDGPSSSLIIRNDITGGQTRILTSLNRGIFLGSTGTVTLTDSLNTNGNSSVGGNLTVTGTLTATISHNSLTDLTTGDPHTQYTLGVGRSGGQTVTGSTAASENLTLVSTSNATKGAVLFTETTASTSSSTGSVILSGGLAISNATDSVSSTNGGASTIAGGLAVAKKAFVGTDLTVGGLLRFTDTTDAPTDLTAGSVILEGGMVVKKRLVVADNVYVQNNLLGVSGNLTIGDNLISTRDVTIGDTSVNGARIVRLRNLNTGTSAFSNLRFENSAGIVNVFLNGANKTSDGGANAFSIRNEITGGEVKVITSGNKGITVASTGNVSMTDNLSVTGGLTVTGSLTATISHNSLTDLTTGDPHTQYTLGAGRSGGQTITGSTAASGNLTLVSTSNATKGSVLFSDTTEAATNLTSGSVILEGGIVVKRRLVVAGNIHVQSNLFGISGNILVGDRLLCSLDCSIGETATNGERRTTVKNLSTGTNSFTTLRLENSNGPVSIYLNGSARSSDGPSNSLIIRNDISGGQTRILTSTNRGIFLESNGDTSVTDNFNVNGTLTNNNTTDATSSTVGGSVTFPGGLAVAKKVFVGTDLSAGGLIRFTDTTEAETNLSSGSVILEGGIVVKRRLVVVGNIYVQSNLFGIGGNIMVGDNVIIGDTSLNGGRTLTVRNLNTGTSAFSNIRLENSTGPVSIFLNGTNKTSDGGANGFTIRNEIAGASVRLLVSTNKGITVASTGNVSMTDNLSITGALSKGSGTFDIPHPVPEKERIGTRLRHSFVESPNAGDNIYRFKITTINKTASIPLPDYYNFLNENTQVFVSGDETLGYGFGKLIGQNVQVTTNVDGNYNILVIGTRKDPVGLKGWNQHGLEYTPTQ